MSDQFTRTVNFRMLACELRKRGYTNVPEAEKIADAAYAAGRQPLKDWAANEAAVNDGAFTSSLAFHMQEGGD